jgi:hypothetical protein
MGFFEWAALFVGAALFDVGVLKSLFHLFLEAAN